MRTKKSSFLIWSEHNLWLYFFSETILKFVYITNTNFLLEFSKSINTWCSHLQITLTLWLHKSLTIKTLISKQYKISVTYIIYLGLRIRYILNEKIWYLSIITVHLNLLLLKPLKSGFQEYLTSLYIKTYSYIIS